VFHKTSVVTTPILVRRPIARIELGRCRRCTTVKAPKTSLGRAGAARTMRLTLVNRLAKM
jgi:hypothetical protein